MATITKRGNNFRIKVSLGYDMNGKQIIKSTTYTPPHDATPKKAEKLANMLLSLNNTAKVMFSLMSVCAFLSLRIGTLKTMLPLN